MADKDFKVKSGIDLGTPLPLTEGGTGQTSANNALNALLPLQTGNSGKVLSTNGTDTSWAVDSSGVSTSGGSTITVASGTTVPLTIQNNGTGNSFVINDVDSDTTPFVIDADGDVGIGITPGTTKLSVRNASDGIVSIIAGNTRGTRFSFNSTGSTIEGVDNTGTASYQPLYVGGSTVTLTTSSTDRLTVDSSGNTTINVIADGTTTTAASGGGFMGLPQNSATTGAYGVVAADAGKHIYSTATRTITLPANGTIALPVGTTITFIAGSGATVTIAITTDTLLLAGAGTTGSRTLAAHGMATAVKVASTTWYISGNGLT